MLYVALLGAIMLPVLTVIVLHAYYKTVLTLLSITGRVKLASTMSIIGNIPRDESSDGLMLNLCSVLVKLCMPFAQPKGLKMLKIRPQYCRQQFVESNDQEQKHHHAYGMLIYISCTTLFY